jgi:hypothetical protein
MGGSLDTSERHGLNRNTPHEALDHILPGPKGRDDMAQTVLLRFASRIRKHARLALPRLQMASARLTTGNF